MSSEVTIVIPAYNHEKYVGATLQSCSAIQADSRPHLFLIDDGSKDETVRIAREFAATHQSDFASIRVDSRSNAGLCATLNFALYEVETPYMLIIASDDLLKPNVIATLLPALKNSAETAFAVGDNDFIDAEGNSITRAAEGVEYRSFLDFYLSGKRTFDYGSIGKYKSFLTGNYLPNGWLIDVRPLRELNGWDTAFILEDWELLTRITKKYSVKIVREYTGSYRIHGSNTTTTRSTNLLLDSMKIYFRELEFSRHSNLMNEWRAGFLSIRNVLKVHTSFFQSFFKELENLSNHPSFSDFVAEIEKRTDSNEKTLGGHENFFARIAEAKIQLLNEFAGNYVAYHRSNSTPESVQQLMNTIPLYDNICRDVAMQNSSKGYKDAIRMIKRILMVNPEFRLAFFRSSNELIKSSNSTFFLGGLAIGTSEFNAGLLQLLGPNLLAWLLWFQIFGAGMLISLKRQFQKLLK